MKGHLPTRIVLAVVVSALTAAALVGCGGQSHSGSSETHSTAPQAVPADIRPAAQAALKLWNSFPATTSPRPVVLLGGALIAPVNGFTGENAKLAFAQGNFRLEAPLPTSPSHSHGYAIIPVGQALKTTAIKGPALVITRVTLGTASFQTDRGLRDLPAWKLYFRGDGGEPAAVLALAPKEIFAPPAVLKQRTSAVTALGSAAASSNGRRITVEFIGGHAGSQPCDFNYSAVVMSSPHAVAVSVIPHPVATGSDVLCTLVGYERRVTVHLGRPLGGRVLISGANGGAIPVVTGTDNPGAATTDSAPVSAATSTGTST